jgi:hypothetical protein
VDVKGTAFFQGTTKKLFSKKQGCYICFVVIIENEYLKAFVPMCKHFIPASFYTTTTKPPCQPHLLQIRYDIKKLSLVLNCENFFDYRQTRKENIVYGNISNPSFKQLWAPVDGRVINLSARINF